VGKQDASTSGKFNVAAHTCKACGAKASTFITKASVIAVCDALFAIVSREGAVHTFVTIIAEALPALADSVAAARKLPGPIAGASYCDPTPGTFVAWVAETFPPATNTVSGAVRGCTRLFLGAVFSTEARVAEARAIPAYTVAVAIMPAAAFSKFALASVEARAAVAELFAVADDAISVEGAVEVARHLGGSNHLLEAR